MGNTKGGCTCSRGPGGTKILGGGKWPENDV